MTADVENFIADGAPPDEYETEAALLFGQIQHLPTDELRAARILPILESIWNRSFELDDPSLLERRPKLAELAGQIERFFGPGARPQVRGM